MHHDHNGSSQLPQKTWRKPGVQLCETCIVRNRALCRGLDANGLGELSRISYRKRLAAETVILHEGAAADWCGIILSGAVKLVKTMLDGRQQIVCMQFPGQFVGSPFGTPSDLNAEAASAVEICCFPRVGFDSLLERYPVLARTLLQDTLGQLEVAHNWMLVLGRKTAEEKVASLIRYLADRALQHDCAPEQGPVEFELPLSRTEIGQFLGLRIETVSRQLTALKSDRVIEFVGTRHIRVLDVPALVRLSDNEAG